MMKFRKIIINSLAYFAASFFLDYNFHQWQWWLLIGCLAIVQINSGID